MSMWPPCFGADGLPKMMGGPVIQNRALNSSSSQENSSHWELCHLMLNVSSCLASCDRVSSSSTCWAWACGQMPWRLQTLLFFLSVSCPLEEYPITLRLLQIWAPKVSGSQTIFVVYQELFLPIILSDCLPSNIPALPTQIQMLRVGSWQKKKKKMGLDERC